ncbi:SCO7613 C-terminal domain-containing membrane protein [Microterricola viridarii]|uniref:DUF2157 domain-containing protein n=1 Tax=Microterricola viridarii TaxID=412690 RepID=A0A1H1TNC6_9MICO|nr:hypothetical protein [Microterricola viridarii]SDS61662.1 hypothetical protein SAMN04489834_1808 [Microterricola viridarii]
MTADAGMRAGGIEPSWPQSTAQLRDRQLCPSCFTPLFGTVCSGCQLDLGSPLADELLRASRAAAERLEYRSEVIRLIRAESSRAPAVVAPAVVAPAAVAPAVAVPPPAYPLPTPAQQTPPQPVPAQPTPATSARGGRSSVQMLLLVVGVGLVAVALVFFLIVAWFVAGLAFRAVTVALLTLLMFVGVSLLARFRMHSTAQGVAVLAVLLVYLDLWAVQATGLFDADLPDPALYWAIGLLVSAPLLLAWFRVTGMRAGSVAGFAAVPVGAGLLGWVLGAPLDQATTGFARLWLVAIVVIVSSLVQLLAPRIGRRMTPSQPLLVERAIVLLLAAPMLPAAFAFGLLTERSQVAAPLWSLGTLAVVCAGQALLSARRPAGLDRAAAIGFGVAAGFTAAAIPIDMGVRATSALDWVLWPVLIAIALLLALDVVRTSAPDPARRHVLGGALLGAALPTGAALLAAGWLLVTAFFDRSPLAPWFTLWVPQAGAQSPGDAVRQAALLLAGGAAMTVAAWAAFGLVRARAVILGAVLVAALMACAVALPWVAAASLGYLAIAAGALCSQAVPALRARTAGLPGLRTLALATLSVNAVAGYLLSFDALWLWLVGSAAVLCLLVGSREMQPRTPLQRPLLLAAAALWALGTTAAAPTAVAASAGLAPHEVVDTRALLVLACGLLLVAFSLPLGRFAAAVDRAWALASTAAVGVVVVAPLPVWPSASTSSPVLLSPVPAALGALLAAAACLLLVGLGANRTLTLGRRAALVAATPLVWLSGMFAVEAARGAGADIDAAALDWWACALGVLALAAALAWQRGALRLGAPPSSTDRALADAGSGLVLLLGAGRVLATLEAPAHWLVLLVAAVGALLAAVDGAGLFNARTRRHQLGWLALLLATAGLWLGLTDAGVTAPEPYALPLAAALLAVAALIARFGQREDAPGSAVAGITAAGLLIALLPSAVAGADGSLLRPILTISIGGVILLGAVLWRPDDWRPDDSRTGAWGAPPPSPLLRLALIGAGGLGVAVAAGARALSTLAGAPGTVSGLFEFWVAVGAAVLLAAALANGDQPGRLTTVLVAVPLVGAGLLECAAIAASPDASGAAAVRAVTVVAVLGAAHVLLAWLRSPALAGWLAPLALGLAALAATVFLARSAGDGAAVPFEWVTVPVAAAWIGSGILHLSRTPGARSWPALGGGLALLLVPSLLADYVHSPLWRVVGLGIVAIAVLLVGLVSRLQAPFVLGSIVVLLHGLAQLWPWLSALYNPTLWWLWFGAGGVLLIAVAARYEKRVANLKAAVATVGSLR